MIRIIGHDPGSKFHLLVISAIGNLSETVALLTQQPKKTIIIVGDEPGTASTDPLDYVGTSTSDTFKINLSDFTRQIPDQEEPEPEPHINGDLSYLYRRPKNNLRIPIRKNHYRVIHQPCWRAGRWKSLT